MKDEKDKSSDLLLDKIKDRLICLDPVAWIEKFLTLENEKFSLHGNGYKPFADMYRYIGIKALEKGGKPVVIVAGRQVGKAQCLDTEIPTIDGFKKLIDIEVGDRLFDEQGNICNVLEVHPVIQEPESYEIEFSSGEKVRACADHLWLTYTKANRVYVRHGKHAEPKIKTTKQIFNTQKTGGKEPENNHSIPCTKPVNYPEQDLPIDPYALGVWLGDGSTDCGRIETADDEILDEFRKVGYSITKIKRSQNDTSKSDAYRIGDVKKTGSAKGWQIGEFTKQLRDCGVLRNKHIPDIYLKGSPSQRMALLQGLLDSDGACDKSGKVEYCTVLPELAQQVALLVKSLGIKTTVNRNESWLNGKRCKDRYRLVFTTKQKVFRLTRKLARINARKTHLMTTTHHYISSVKKIDPVPMRCLTVDSPSNLFLITRSFIPTHNTTLAAALELYFMGCGLFGNGANSPMRIVHAFPEQSYGFSYTKTKLNPMIAGSLITENGDLPKNGKTKSYLQLLIDQASDSSDSLHFKQFSGGNHIFIESTGANGDRLRGKTLDLIFFDEVQKMFSASIANATKVLTQSKYGPPGDGVQVYFGTPLQKGSTYHDLWQASDQQYFHLQCDKCKEYFPLYTPGSPDWEKIWVYGFTVRCTHCGFEQDKREAVERGKWIPTKNPNECKYIGFHINQLYVPTFTKEKVISEKPENNPTNTERAYQNEVLGEFYSGETGIISLDQIRDICGDTERKFKKSISPDENKLVFLGIDIGEKNDFEQLVDSPRVKTQGQSYSVAVVLVADGPERLSIEFATKFPRNDLAYKKGIIEELYRKYSVNLAVMDLGYTRDLSEMLQTQFGDKLLCSQASGKVNDHIKYNDDVFPKVITFERDYYIGEVYERMKRGCIRFPLGSFEQIYWLMNHCTSMELKPSLTRSGDASPHYIKGSTPNDGFAALINAYLAYKFYITDGFNIKHPSLMKDKVKQGASVIGASINFHSGGNKALNNR